MRRIPVIVTKEQALAAFNYALAFADKKASESNEKRSHSTIHRHCYIGKIGEFALANFLNANGIKRDFTNYIMEFDPDAPIDDGDFITNSGSKLDVKTSDINDEWLKMNPNVHRSHGNIQHYVSVSVDYSTIDSFDDVTCYLDGYIKGYDFNMKKNTTGQYVEDHVDQWGKLWRRVQKKRLEPIESWLVKLFKD